jgi:hypothetical protein
MKMKRLHLVLKRHAQRCIQIHTANPSLNFTEVDKLKDQVTEELLEPYRQWLCANAKDRWRIIAKTHTLIEFRFASSSDQIYFKLTFSDDIIPRQHHKNKETISGQTGSLSGKSYLIRKQFRDIAKKEAAEERLPYVRRGNRLVFRKGAGAIVIFFRTQLVAEKLGIIWRMKMKHHLYLRLDRVAVNHMINSMMSQIIAAGGVADKTSYDTITEFWRMETKLSHLYIRPDTATTNHAIRKVAVRHRGGGLIAQTKIIKNFNAEITRSYKEWLRENAKGWTNIAPFNIVHIFIVSFADETDMIYFKMMFADNIISRDDLKAGKVW